MSSSVMDRLYAVSQAKRTLLPIISTELLNSLEQHSLPTIRNSWYFIAAVTVTVLNRSDEVVKIYRHAVGSDQDGGSVKLSRDEHLKILRRIREALIKTIVIAGAPKTIHSILALKEVTPEDLQDYPSRPSPTSRREDIYRAPSSTVLDRGQAFLKGLYRDRTEGISKLIDHSGTEDLGLIVRLLYSHILSNTAVLNPAETSFVLIAGLFPQDANLELAGHLQGALNNGAEIEEVRAVRDIVVRICQSAGMTSLDESPVSGWGWKQEVANI